MTFKDFVKGVAYAPAWILSGIFKLILGYTYLDKDGQEKKGTGLFSIVTAGLDILAQGVIAAVDYVARGFSGLIANHAKAISVAFWTSLAVAGLAVLSVAFWPAALAAVVNFTVAGVSIASLVGAGYVPQLLAVGGLAYLATSASVYVVAAVVNTINGIRDFFTKPRSSRGLDDHSAYDAHSNLDADFSSTQRMQKAMQNAMEILEPKASDDFHAGDAEPQHSQPIFQAAAQVADQPAATSDLDAAPSPTRS
ncbi:hypothetical protein [Legionella worsleiensis]|uniref:Transmembrane protein n=1 Tax=Legionella worsleiensis TaxID=45076 RepID=A0A0W1AEM1_9GAMM|nr:hypothetical protein [Legionella worsleiensis]KTD79788.1 hypothetical protein Lwor_1302 [Legionella worsleiensis]STY32299.1 Uncharacterised protein [Legionella worsleiensis]